MQTKAVPKLIECANCQLQLPIRLARPGETGSSWQCASCNARYHGVLEDEIGREFLNHIVVAPAPNPRVMVGREVVAELLRRKPNNTPAVDSRRHFRKSSSENVSIVADNHELPADCIDVSVGGIGCVSPVEISLGRSVLMRFGSLPNSPICSGVVRSCESWDGGYRIGIEFTH